MSFKNITTNAAQAERDGHYKEAGRLWQEALFLAKKEDNKRWITSRAEFCAKAAGGRFIAIINTGINI